MDSPDVPVSPQIRRMTWGRIEVEGHGTFKDVKLYPGGCREWNWNESGTSHGRGIQRADVDELLGRGAKVVVLTKGMYGRLRVPSELVTNLREGGIQVHVLKTKDALDIYNELCRRVPVGGLFHTTC